MNTIAILGSGDLAGALAHRIAREELARRVVLVDENDGRARGKALDVLQSGAVDGFDTRVEGVRDLGATSAADVVVVADPEELADPVLAAGRAERLLARLRPALGKAVLLVAAADPSAVVEAAARAEVPRERVLGSAPVAWRSAVCRLVAHEVGIASREVGATALGLVPPRLVVPTGSVTVSGVPLEQLSRVALRRALEAVQRRAPGPLALAAAAARVIQAVTASRPSLLPVVTVLQGEYGHRRIALAVPARLGGGRVREVLELPLEPVDRVAFDNAAQSRYQAG
jgi:malate dehydrogenase